MLYRCRILRPSCSSWHDVEAPTWQEAANTFHERELDTVGGLRFRHELDAARSEIIVFAVVEVEGHGQIFSRVYLQGIWRKGGVKPLAPVTLESIAEELHFQRPAEELLTPWQGEESWEEASTRRWGDDNRKKWGKKA